MRQSANEEVARKKDDIFDQYLEEPDWSECIDQLFCRVFANMTRGPKPMLLDQAPRNGVVEDVDRFLDLAATEEDHGEVRCRKIEKLLSPQDGCGTGSYDASRTRTELITSDPKVQ